MMKNLLETLPDFDDMDEVSKIATSSKAKLEDAKNRLEELVARCIRDAMINQDYWVNGKPPTMSYAQTVISVYGNTEEDAKTLKGLRAEIVSYGEEYQRSKLILDNMKDRIHVWQTHSANTRKVGI